MLSPGGAEATFLKSPVCPKIPFESVEIDLLNSQLLEYVVHKQTCCLSAISLIPVGPFSDNYPYLHAACMFVEIVVHTIADVFTVEGVNSKSVASPIGEGGLIDVQCPEL